MQRNGSEMYIRSEEQRERGREYQRRYRENNPDASRATVQRYREQNRDRIRARQRELRALRKDEIRARERTQFLTKLEKLAGRPRPNACEACGGPPGKRPLRFDHCHNEQTFRGWICDGCNLALGHAKDSPERLRKLADYLERSRS